MVYCTSTYTIQILYTIKMQIVLCYSEHTVTVLNYKSKHWFVTRGSPAVEIIVRRRDWRRGFQSCCSPWCSEERTVSERGRGWASEGRDAASPQAIEGSAGRLSLACLREMLSDYLCQSRLRIITHLQDLLHLQALHYSLQHLQEPHRCLHPELLNCSDVPGRPDERVCGPVPSLALTKLYLPWQFSSWNWKSLFWRNHLWLCSQFFT